MVTAALLDEGADLTDAIIRRPGQARGCERTVTFDRGFARLDGVELLA